MTFELDVQKIYSELSQVRRELGSLKSSVEQLGQAIRLLDGVISLRVSAAFRALQKAA